jgi:hypothetical protein
MNKNKKGWLVFLLLLAGVFLYYTNLPADGRSCLPDDSNCRTSYPVTGTHTIGQPLYAYLLQQQEAQKATEQQTHFWETPQFWAAVSVTAAILLIYGMWERGSDRGFFQNRGR